MPTDPAVLTSEGSLWEIWVASRTIPPNRFNRCCLITVVSVAILYAVAGGGTSTFLAARVREFADFGFAFSVGILGFLIAGFTFFASGSREMFVTMTEIIEKRSGLIYLKSVFFILARVFIFYLVYASYCMAIKFTAFPGGLITVLLEGLPWSQLSKAIVSRAAFVLTVSASCHALLMLKSFTFTIYMSIMASIRFNLEERRNTAELFAKLWRDVEQNRDHERG